jgi:DNA-binding NarL/FixJ family response regulator
MIHTMQGNRATTTLDLPIAPASEGGDRPDKATDGGDAMDGVAQANQPAVSRVLLVDDHRTFSEALALAIDRDAGLACVGTPTTIAEALVMVERTQPDVVLLDIYLPDGDGIEAIPSIRALQPSVRVLVMTGHTDVGVMARAASAGATGFLPKENPIGAVLGAIRAARDDEMLVNGTTLAAILSRVGRAPSDDRGRAMDATHLTAREWDVLDLMGQGFDPQSIAARLAISIHTCRGYQKSIFAKLDAHSQLEAVVVAVRRGLMAGLER